MQRRRGDSGVRGEADQEGHAGSYFWRQAGRQGHHSTAESTLRSYGSRTNKNHIQIGRERVVVNEMNSNNQNHDRNNIFTKQEYISEYFSQLPPFRAPSSLSCLIFSQQLLLVGWRGLGCLLGSKNLQL